MNEYVKISVAENGFIVELYVWSENAHCPVLETFIAKTLSQALKTASEALKVASR